MDEAALAGWLRAAAGARSLSVDSVKRLSGGAIQQNWRIDAIVEGSPEAWVLRTDNPASLTHSRSRAEEFAILRAAHGAGVTVPEPLFLCADAAVIGRPFFVMRRADGVAAAHRVVRSDTLGGGREALAEALGRELARIHAIVPPRADLACLGEPRGDASRAFVSDMRAAIDRAGTPRPVLEWGLRHLERTVPPPCAPVLIHNDFRTGNYMVDERGITAILDWEFAAWGDPHADLGWLCAKCWRFGGPGEAGGVGSRAALYRGYAEEGGSDIDPARVAWWELGATVRWAVIAADQAARHLSGAERSLELALTGHIVPALERDIMQTT